MHSGKHSCLTMITERAEGEGNQSDRATVCSLLLHPPEDTVHAPLRVALDVLDTSLAFQHLMQVHRLSTGALEPGQLTPRQPAGSVANSKKITPETERIMRS